VQIIAVDLALDRKAGRVKAGALGTPPIPVNPSAVDTDPESRSQQAKERPAEPFIDDIAAFARMLGAEKSGNLDSSATAGSSNASVPGKNRLPA
jgi:hypothetical protein